MTGSPARETLAYPPPPGEARPVVAHSEEPVVSDPASEMLDAVDRMGSLLLGSQERLLAALAEVSRNGRRDESTVVTSSPGTDGPAVPSGLPFTAPVSGDRVVPIGLQFAPPRAEERVAPAPPGVAAAPRPADQAERSAGPTAAPAAPVPSPPARTEAETPRGVWMVNLVSAVVVAVVLTIVLLIVNII